MLEWEQTRYNSYRAELPVYGTVRVENYGGKSWGVNVSVPGYSTTLVEGAFPSAEQAKAAADEFVAKKVRAFLSGESKEGQSGG